MADAPRADRPDWDGPRGAGARLVLDGDPGPRRRPGVRGRRLRIADDVHGLLTLFAIGYRDLTPSELGLPPDDDDAVEPVSDFRAWVEQDLGITVPLEWPAAGVEAAFDRWGLRTLWIMVGADDSNTGTPGYSRPAALIHGLDETSTPQGARALLGDPEHEGERFLRYVVRGRYVHLEFASGTLTQVALMTTAP